MGMLAKILRMHFREKLWLREIAKRKVSPAIPLSTGCQEDVAEPVYPAEMTPSILYPYREQLKVWLSADRHRPKRDRRAAPVMFRHLQTQDQHRRRTVVKS